MTLTSGVPVTTSDVTAAGTIYFTPFQGNRISLFNGTEWCSLAFTEVSLSLTLTSAKNYDVFGYNNNGALTLELSSAWTNDTTRANALTTQDGIYVKSGATTRRYLGTLRASGTNTTEDSKSKRYLWNLYNRRSKKLYVTEATASWTYSSAVWRPWNNNTANRVEYVCGLSEDTVSMGFNFMMSTGIVNFSIAYDLTNNYTDFNLPVGSTGSYVSGSMAYNGATGVGYHFLQLVEYCGSGTPTVYGSGLGATGQIMV